MLDDCIMADPCMFIMIAAAVVVVSLDTGRLYLVVGPRGFVVYCSTGTGSLVLRPAEMEWDKFGLKAIPSASVDAQSFRKG